MRERACHGITATRVERPFQAHAVDVGVVGTARLATRQPVVGFLKVAGAAGEVGASEPDAVVVGCFASEALQRGAESLERQRLGFEKPVRAQLRDRIGRENPTAFRARIDAIGAVRKRSRPGARLAASAAIASEPASMRARLSSAAARWPWATASRARSSAARRAFGAPGGIRAQAFRAGSMWPSAASLAPRAYSTSARPGWRRGETGEFLPRLGEAAQRLVMLGGGERGAIAPGRDAPNQAVSQRGGDDREHGQGTNRRAERKSLEEGFHAALEKREARSLAAPSRRVSRSLVRRRRNSIQ